MKYLAPLFCICASNCCADQTLTIVKDYVVMRINQLSPEQQLVLLTKEDKIKLDTYKEILNLIARVEDN